MAQQSEQEAHVNVASQPGEREDEIFSFNLGISPPASQPSQPSQLSVSQLEILEEAVVDARVTAALKFAEATTSEPTLPASEVYKTLKKNTKITNELIEKFYHWMTHVKQTKDGSNVVCIYNMILNEIKVRQYQELIYIVPLDIVNFMLGTHDQSCIDKSTNKAYRFDIE
ncbi:hypothetical protein Ahy_A07g031914 [Arachis hypogaea]|uniref:Uncharacterized protein n=1 Tax=Arachis hypogaea TaxID=3818 RepID=A0A445C5J5_ARAHY|nr:hypothetical protein Ahy_A07g031914 [Arachis hypogaea]